MTSPEDDLKDYGSKRAQHVRVTAWVVIVALIVGGGGSAVLSLLFG